MLEKSEISEKNIVQYPHVNGARHSTYDATVGTIIKKGKDVGSSYILKPRGVVWVVSKEEFHLPPDITALATVRTTWAHKGVFALNVGVVDPGWKGPVATALVNFSTEEFEVKIGEGFMRLVFNKHSAAVIMIPPPACPRERYVKEIMIKSLNFADSFLNMNSLVEEVAKEIFKLGKIARFFAWLGLAATFLSIFLPIAYSVMVDSGASKVAIGKLESRVEQLERLEQKGKENRQDNPPAESGAATSTAGKLAKPNKEGKSQGASDQEK